MMYKYSVETTRVKEKRLCIGLYNYLLDRQGKDLNRCQTNRNEKAKGRTINTILIVSILFYPVSALIWIYVICKYLTHMLEGFCVNVLYLLSFRDKLHAWIDSHQWTRIKPKTRMCKRYNFVKFRFQCIWLCIGFDHVVEMKTLTKPCLAFWELLIMEKNI